MRHKVFISACLLLLLAAPFALAATSTVKLRDGTEVRGEIRKVGSSYAVVLSDGTRTLYTPAQILSIDGVPLNADAPPPADTAAKPTSAGTPPAKPAEPAPAPGQVSNSFRSAKGKADICTSPIIAVSIWEKWIEKNSTSAELPQANAELDKWKKLNADEAEKINGKWVGGAARKELLDKVEGLVNEAATLEDGNVLNAIKKYEEALKLYPKHFQANFRLGWYLLTKGSKQYHERCLQLLEAARNVNPNVPEVWCNLAIAYNYRKRFEDSILAANKAVELYDNKETCQQLINAIEFAPPGIRTANPRIRPVIENARVVANKHGVSSGSGAWTFFSPGYFDALRAKDGKPPIEGDQTGGPPGVVGNGSGFFISSDGYILTNRHVVDSGPGHFYRVRTDDGTEMNADVVAVDDKYDIALLKIQTDTPVPAMNIATDNPNPAATALVLGYPVTPGKQPSLQVTSGDVKSIHVGEKYEVWYALSTTHGNSGGPIVDRMGRVIGILSAGQRVDENVTYVYGIGPNQIEDFLTRIGEKAPKITFAPPLAKPPEFDGETLAMTHRKSTLLILIIRGEGGKDSSE